MDDGIDAPSCDEGSTAAAAAAAAAAGGGVPSEVAKKQCAAGPPELAPAPPTALPPLAAAPCSSPRLSPGAASGRAKGDPPTTAEPPPPLRATVWSHSNCKMICRSTSTGPLRRTGPAKGRALRKWFRTASIAGDESVQPKIVTPVRQALPCARCRSSSSAGSSATEATASWTLAHEWRDHS